MGSPVCKWIQRAISSNPLSDRRSTIEVPTICAKAQSALEANSDTESLIMNGFVMNRTASGSARITSANSRQSSVNHLQHVVNLVRFLVTGRVPQKLAIIFTYLSQGFNQSVVRVDGANNVRSISFVLRIWMIDTGNKNAVTIDYFSHYIVAFECLMDRASRSFMPRCRCMIAHVKPPLFKLIPFAFC